MVFLLSIDINISECLVNSHHYTIPGCPVNLPIYGLLTDADGNHNIISVVKFQLQKNDCIPIFNVSIPFIPLDLVVVFDIFIIFIV
jgi:hypothetical protein